MRLSFLFPPIPMFKALGEKLQAKYGDVGPDAADALVTIGGDGSVLYALPLAKGRTVFGLTPKESNSFAYTANRFDARENLVGVIERSEKFPLHPLNVRLRYADGAEQNLVAFNSISIERDDAQAAMMDLTGHFNGASRTQRVMGNGLAFSTPFGSTGLNYSEGGPILSLQQPAMILTGMGIGQPAGFKSFVATGNESFDVECIVSRGKRPLRIDIDGRPSLKPSPDNPVTGVHIEIAAEPAAYVGVRPGSLHPFKRLRLA